LDGPWWGRDAESSQAEPSSFGLVVAVAVFVALLSIVVAFDLFELLERGYDVFSNISNLSNGVRYENEKRTIQRLSAQIEDP
jgi:hypothetical protein